MKASRGENDDELVETAIETIDSYSLLDTEEQQSADVTNIPLEMADALQKALESAPELSTHGEKWATAALLLKKANLHLQYLSFGRTALQSGYSNSSFASTLTEDALDNNDLETARLAINQSARFTTETDCSGLRKLSEQYTQLKDTKKANYYTEKAASCEQQKKRQERTANREGGLYLGVYVIPLFKLNYGGVAAIQTKKLMIGHPTCSSTKNAIA
ncbi:MAG: hypothetical protein IPL65_12800 [Lewinellaceae bacterium]|nr:hypothetical protein [Lewinellaceae bacterium]